jgi:proteasome lid subunit RPN8/RPN11
MKYQPPILLKTEADVRAEENLYYEVASNGIFQVTDTELYRAVTQVTREVPGLYPSRERLEMRFPPLPAEPLEEVLAFFAEVNHRFQGEAIVMIFFDPEARSYDYGSAPRPEGHRLFGTIHSHADLSAYSSSVDCDDERFGDGLHVVYGHFGSSALSRSAGFAAGGRRFHVEPAQVLPDCGVPRRAARSDWMARVAFEETKSWAEAARGWEGAGGAVPLIGEAPYGEA